MEETEELEPPTSPAAAIVEPKSYFSELPIEVIRLIFDYLNPSDRQTTVPAVCRQWLELSQDRSYWPEHRLYFENCKLVTSQPPANIFLHTKRKFRSLTLRGISKFGELCDDFWDKMGAMVIEIHFINCYNLSSFVFITILKKLRRLRKLVIKDCLVHLFNAEELYEEIKDTLNNIEVFEVGTVNVNQFVVESFISAMPNLKSLTIKGLDCTQRMADRSFLMRRDREREVRMHYNFQQLHSTFSKIMKTVVARADNITELHLEPQATKVFINERTLIGELLKLPNLHLRAFSFVSEGISSDTLQRFFSAQTGIEQLDIYRSRNMKVRDLEFICQTLHGLRTLRLMSGGPDLDGLKIFRGMARLQTLRINYMSVRPVTYEPRYLPRMRKLEMSGRRVQLSIHDVTNLCYTLKGLTYLSLEGNELGDDEIQIVFSALRRLRVLLLNDCVRITDAGLMGVRDTKYLTGEGDGESENESTNTLVACADYSVANLRGLQTLEIAACTGITDRALKSCFHLPELSRLRMDFLGNITMDGLRALRQNCPMLKSVSLKHCDKIPRYTEWTELDFSEVGGENPAANSSQKAA